MLLEASGFAQAGTDGSPAGDGAEGIGPGDGGEAKGGEGSRAVVHEVELSNAEFAGALGEALEVLAPVEVRVGGNGFGVVSGEGIEVGEVVGVFGADLEGHAEGEQDEEDAGGAELDEVPEGCGGDGEKGEDDEDVAETDVDGEGEGDEEDGGGDECGGEGGERDAADADEDEGSAADGEGEEGERSFEDEQEGEEEPVAVGEEFAIEDGGVTGGGVGAGLGEAGADE